ncbi:MAG: hypothetical protein M3Q73_02205 [bacterium]|nr:hypothetical protein [bacterium]
MKYDKIEVKKLENSEVEITGVIPAEALVSYRKKALRTIGENVNIPGFRKGHVPEKVLVDKVGELYILEEAAELALKDTTPEIIQNNTPTYVGRPRLSITKIAPGSPLEFKINVDVMPEVTLPDYKKIAKTEMATKADKIEVTEKDLVDVIAEVRKQRAHHAYHLAHKDDTEHKHTDDEIEKFMPEFNDEFVKTIGAFESVEDFKTKAKENLQKEKEQRAHEKKRGELLEKLVSETKLALPESIINAELERMFAQFENDIKGVGLKVEDYLKHIKKTPEDLIKDWKPDAEKRAKLNVILEEIAKVEKIEPEADKVKEQVEHLVKHHKDVDRVRAQLYVEHTLRLEKTIKFLEEQK